MKSKKRRVLEIFLCGPIQLKNLSIAFFFLNLLQSTFIGFSLFFLFLIFAGILDFIPLLLLICNYSAHIKQHQ